MLDHIRRWLDTPAAADPVDTASTARAVSVLLVAAARADGGFAADEAREVARLVSSHFSLPADETAELVAAAAAEDADDLFPVARLLVERLDRRERRAVLELMWRVVFSDGRLESREDVLMRRAARLLDLPHADFIAMKQAARRAADPTDPRDRGDPGD